ncbi:hypothetical protein GWI33_015189 [Rhynchophorus ferrugineus]|uniref:COMM domain-containing protein 4 n=1 Tax=Rhynchophorus ferrugineus TaxID=354439 RepID=A0A834I444_RHYFE|nr:hypothetical protein GWI33_015189 [Rhynchophorus ferrugineus]
MKFRFNGDADCPDWILAEIYNLSRLSSVKLKLLGQIVAQAIINPPLQMEKVDKLFVDSKLDTDINLKACIACLTFIFSSTIRFSCDSSALQTELQQLGLPREHSISIKKILDEYSSSLIDHFRSQSLKVNRLEDVSSKVDETTKCAVLSLSTTHDNNTETLLLAPNTVDDLLRELVNIKTKMENLKQVM